MALSDLASASTLHQWIGRRAQRHGDRIAATFIDDDRVETSWTYRGLWQRSCAVAARLGDLEKGLRGRPSSDPSDAPRALLLYPPGIDFLSAFFGCHIAGWIPVPTCYPKPGREMPRLDSAALDCAPSAVLADTTTIDGIDPAKFGEAARSVARLSTSFDGDADFESHWIDPDSMSSNRSGLALLQYTSGSTSDPKGVMVRQSNLMANLEAIRRGFHIDWQKDDAEVTDSGVFWLPFFHDMGLIGGILEPLYVGGRTVLMSPRSFLQRPIRWLQAISDHQAVISGAPNFAYQLCVDRIAPDQTDTLDLSHWRIAFSGAEPILARTLADFANRFSSCGFSPSAFYPCYGLAEASLLAAGGDGPGQPKVLTVDRESLGEGKPRVVPQTAATQTAGIQSTAVQSTGPSLQKLVCCGSAAHRTDLVLVDPQSLTEVESCIVGEIWIRGNSIAAGYWNRHNENQTLFDAKLADGRSGFCRTGDLGFLHEGQLYVTGRLKDIIILRGRNLFPQDIESTVSETIGSDGGQCAAFAVDSGRGESLAIVAELPRRADKSSLPDLVREIRRSVIGTHEVDPAHVWLVRQASVPLTSSGKVQRSRCREMFHGGEIKTKHRYDRASVSEQVPLGFPEMPNTLSRQDVPLLMSSIETWITKWLVVRAGVDPADVDLDKPFADYGLDSMTAVEMSGEIEDWSDVELTPIVAWNYPTVSRLSQYIAEQVIDERVITDDINPTIHHNEVSEAELAELLGELENLSDDEIEDALAEKRHS